MASKKRNLLGFLQGGSRKKEKGGNPPDNALDQSPGESSAAGPSIAQARVSISKQSTTEGTKGMLEGLFSRNKTPLTRPTTPAAIHTTEQQPLSAEPVAAIYTTEQEHLRDEVADTPSASAGKLTSKQAETLPESATNHKKALFLELGIRAIDLFSEVSDIADLALPKPVGDVLSKVTAVLRTLKVCTT
jgi:hypothetical protein